MPQNDIPVTWHDFGATDARQYVSPPKPDDDKYSRGVLGIMTGSPSFPGAAVLGVEGASRTGVGMIRYLGPGRATRLVMQRRPEIVTAEGRVQAWLVGSGIDAASREPAVTAALIEVLGQGHPVIIDAGALDLIAHATGPAIITPHAGELQKLLGDRGVTVSRADISRDPALWAAQAARMLGVAVLLKGHVTHTIAAPGPARAFGSAPARGASGDSERAPESTRAREAGPAVIQVPVPADPSAVVASVGLEAVAFRTVSPTTELATAGSGDVLAGILGALLAAHADEVLSNPSALARIAAAADVLHGLAGARASNGGPITALDIAEALPATIAHLRCLP
ncbi:ADP/ATP-dependent (S)-NAD(P)H-hydrate dehydratase [Subtercola sp. RTI3]|uniref:ADP-dependent NAD(P)H-hydrate dehydratase n=1 Tax=Subtercola sp. RTI3 TaxID=3048639 RepID=UPI002B235314|nr:ADP/ATP-dependent (S)-NAD(P)H-hydrate dehydratase [Subtercola sp. RTI3]MEA9985230.1 NAD(P)H-hydrate dehydratase [Subtercola sp. RTI3]